MVEGALTDRTQPAVSVEAAFFVVVDVSADEEELVSDFAVSGLEVESPFDELFVDCLLEEPESPLTDVIDEDSAPRLSVL